MTFLPGQSVYTRYACPECGQDLHVHRVPHGQFMIARCDNEKCANKNGATVDIHSSVVISIHD